MALILNGTGAVSGIADLTVDTNTLYVNPTTDRVGIGTTTPATKLDLVGSNSRYTYDVNNAYTLTTSLNPAGSAFATSYQNAASHIFQVSGADKLTIDSNGIVGIGTTGSIGGAKLNVLGGIQTSESTGNVMKVTRCFYYLFTATGTRNIQFTQPDTVSYSIEVTMSSAYSYANYSGAMKSVFVGGANNSSTSIYGAGQTSMYSLGSMSTGYAFGTQTKPSNTVLNIPIVFSGTPSSPVYIVVEVYGGVAGFSNIALV